MHTYEQSLYKEIHYNVVYIAVTFSVSSSQTHRLSPVLDYGLPLSPFLDKVKERKNNVLAG